MATNSGRWGQSVKLKITFETQKSHFKCDFGFSKRSLFS